MHPVPGCMSRAQPVLLRSLLARRRRCIATRLPSPQAPGSPGSRGNPGAISMDAGRLLFTTMGVLSVAALLIILLVRYAIISQEYAVVNEIRDQIVACSREIDILNVQLNAAVSLEEAREAALEAGMGYPQADQIGRIQGTEPSLAGGQAAPQ